MTEQGVLRLRGFVQVKLCDAASGGFTHTLVGHREAVWAAAWSPISEWHLVTGACDGQVCRHAHCCSQGQDPCRAFATPSSLASLFRMLNVCAGPLLGYPAIGLPAHL